MEPTCSYITEWASIMQDPHFCGKRTIPGTDRCPEHTTEEER